MQLPPCKVSHCFGLESHRNWCTDKTYTCSRHTNGFCPHCLWSWPGPNTHQDSSDEWPDCVEHNHDLHSDASTFALKEPFFGVGFTLKQFFTSKFIVNSHNYKETASNTLNSSWNWGGKNWNCCFLCSEQLNMQAYVLFINTFSCLWHLHETLNDHMLIHVQSVRTQYCCHNPSVGILSCVIGQKPRYNTLAGMPSHVLSKFRWNFLFVLPPYNAYYCTAVTKEMFYCCCSISATCCQRVNLHSHALNFEIIQSNLHKNIAHAIM